MRCVIDTLDLQKHATADDHTFDPLPLYCLSKYHWHSTRLQIY